MPLRMVRAVGLTYEPVTAAGLSHFRFFYARLALLFVLHFLPDIAESVHRMIPMLVNSDLLSFRGLSRAS